jgi:uncharacterized integral membrane protein
MLALIFLLIFGSGIAYLALQNTSLVTLTILNYTLSDVPLFSVMIASMLVGALLIYVIHLANSISTALTIHNKDKTIKQSRENVTELTKNIHKLELENEALTKDGPSANSDANAL